MTASRQRRVRFTKADVQRAVQGAIDAAGKTAVRIEVEVDGIVIRVVLTEQPAVPLSGNPLDRWREQCRAG